MMHNSTFFRDIKRKDKRRLSIQLASIEQEISDLALEIKSLKEISHIENRLKKIKKNIEVFLE